MAEKGDPVDKHEDPELEQHLKQIEEESSDIAQRIQENISQELNSHIAKLGEDFRSAFDDRIKTVTSQSRSQASEEMSKKQTDILRTNKVFREVCRPLGQKWKDVFDILVSDLTPEQKQTELEKVQREKPFMQSYKALMTWKELKGDSFDVRELVPALRTVGCDDLAQITLKILDSDKDALYYYSDGTKPKTQGEASGSQLKATAAAAATASASSAGDGLNKASVNAEDALDDRHLLQVAKKLGSEWEWLAKGLNVPAGEIAEIVESEGKTYQAAFKVLWNWRESKTNLSDGFQELVSQLKLKSRSDIADLLLH